MSEQSEQAALTVVCDRLDIQDVLIRYCTGLDSRQWALLEEVFTTDAEADFGALGGRHLGVEAIADFVRGVLQGCDATQHLLGNFDVAVDGDRATASCYFQAQHVLLGGSGGHTYLVGGSYRDRLARSAAGWRITYRELVPTWSDGNAGLFAEAAGRLAASAG